MSLREVPSQGFVESVKQTLLTKYCTLNGRARRSEFWYFMLFGFLAGIVVDILQAIGLNFPIYVTELVPGVPLEYGALSAIFTLALLLPNICVSIRRLHDINKSGLWLLLGFLPIIGGIILLVWFCSNSDPMPNQFGDSPKYKNVE